MSSKQSLEKIGFYTLSDARAKNASFTSPLWRCEIILTEACNFKCPYCRPLRSDCRGAIDFQKAFRILDSWIFQGLKNIRFSGGEPTLYGSDEYHSLTQLAKRARHGGVSGIAISTNGSASQDKYETLLRSGVNDFSVSLDGCCAATVEKMAGNKPGILDVITQNISFLAKRAYTTVGIVLNENNLHECIDTIKFAHELGVQDIRVIPSAQYNQNIDELKNVPTDIITKHPILRYRINNLLQNRYVRGLKSTDSTRCRLVLDDMAVAGGKFEAKHFPCIIYLREGGNPIGNMNEDYRKSRQAWYEKHNTHQDPICFKNCLDVCVDYNNKAEE